ncbi:MAG: heavy-metal-associated domain-containing protein [Sulfuricurvum sp.]
MKQTFEVANIRCGGCANTITKALTEAGFQEISVDLSCEPRKVTAEIADEAQLAHFKSVLIKLGYPLCDSERGFTEDAVLKAKSFVSCAVGKFTEKI